MRRGDGEEFLMHMDLGNITEAESCDIYTGLEIQYTHSCTLQKHCFSTSELISIKEVSASGKQHSMLKVKHAVATQWDLEVVHFCS